MENKKLTKQVFLRFVIGKFIPLLLLTLSVALAFNIYRRLNRSAMESRNRDYIKDSSVSLGRKVDNIFTDAMATIKSTAILYSRSITGENDAVAMLVDLEESTQFDYVRFMAADGTDYTSQGPVINSLGEVVNVSSRDYFKDGMQGGSGIFALQESMVTGQKQIGFYAPVSQNDNIVGILVGFYREGTLNQKLDVNFYGQKADILIIDQTGNLVTASKSANMIYLFDRDSDPDHISALLNSSWLDEENSRKVKNAYENHTSAAFEYWVNEKDNLGYITALSSVPWVICETFPSGAVDVLDRSANQSARVLQIMLIVVFACYIVFLLIRQVYMRRTMEEQNRITSYVAAATSDIFKKIVYIDLEQETYEDISSVPILEKKQGELETLINYLVNASAEKKPLLRNQTSELEDFLDPSFLSRTAGNKTPNLINRFRVGDAEEYYNLSFVATEKKGGFAGKGVLVFQNVTDAKEKELQATKELEQAYYAAESASRAKSSFLFNMSHDIRTPMNAIIGYAELMEKHLGDPKTAADYLSKLKNSSNFLLSLINNVLDMARIESGQTKLEETLWNSKRFNDDLAGVLETPLRQKNLSFTRTINIQHENVMCDATKLRQIFLNILSNAVKYTPEGGHISLDLEEIPSDREGYAIFRTTIRDNGIGMSKEFLPTLFEEFTREKNTTESKIIGTGLGMPIVKSLVELMEGTIEVDSVQGEGTTFVVTLPHKIANAEEEAQAEVEKTKEQAFDFTGRRILVTEDNELNAEIAVTLLEENGFEVDIAENGAVCLEKLREAEDHYYDLILMDIQMPVMNGYQAAEAIRGMTGPAKDIPIIAMTANAFEEDKRHAMESGMNEHIAKPFDVKILLGAIGRILEQQSGR